MKEKDGALTISNPRLLCAIYFSLLAIMATIAVDTFFYLMGVEQFIPIYQGIILAVFCAAFFGALFGEKMVHCKKPYRKRVFWWGFLLVIAALPLYNLGFLVLWQAHNQELFENTTFANFALSYLFIFFYGFMLAGFWLAIFAGLAALYLRAYLVYYLLDSLNVTRRTKKNPGPHHRAKK